MTKEEQTRAIQQLARLGGQPTLDLADLAVGRWIDLLDRYQARSAGWEAFFELADFMTDEDYFTTLGHVWRYEHNMFAEGTSGTKARLFCPPGRDATKRRLAMTQDEVAVFIGLPAEVEVWCGTSGNALDGCCWTISKEVAIGFACTEAAMSDGHEAFLLHGYISKLSIMVFFDKSNEQEVVIDPSHVQTFSSTQLPILTDDEQQLGFEVVDVAIIHHNRKTQFPTLLTACKIVGPRVRITRLLMDATTPIYVIQTRETESSDWTSILQAFTDPVEAFGRAEQLSDGQ